MTSHNGISNDIGRAAVDVQAWSGQLSKHVPVQLSKDASGQLRQVVGRLNKAAKRLVE